MATQTNNLVLLESGVTRTVDASNDSLVVGAPLTLSSALTVSSGGIAVTGDSSIIGDLVITGDVVSRGQTNLLVKDPIIDLAVGNSGTVATPGGFSLQMNRNSGFTAGTVTVFVAGVVATSAPSITYTDAGSSSLLAANDIVAISSSIDGNNDGLYAVASVSGAAFPQTVTLKGIGGTSVSGSTPFVQNQVTSDTGNTAAAYKVDLAAVLVADGSASFKDGSGSSYAKGTLISAYEANAADTDFTGNAAYTVPSVTQTLQAAYNGGATITTASSTNLAITLSSGGFVVNGSGTVDMGASGTDLTAFNVGTGSADLQASGAVTIDSTGGSISIGGDSDAQAINLGTGSAARTITVGNVTGATAVVVNTGTGASSITVTGAGTFSLTAGTGQIDLATNATDHTTRIGSATGVSAFTARAGTGAMSFNAGGVYDVNATGNVTIDSSGGTIGVGTDTVSQNISVGTAGTRTISVGSSAATVNIDGGAVSIDGTDNSNLTVTGSGKTLTLSAAGGGAQQVSVQSAGTGTPGATPAIALAATAGGFDFQGVLSSRLRLNTNSGSNQTLTLEALNSGAGQGIVTVRAEDLVNIGDYSTFSSAIIGLQNWTYLNKAMGLQLTAGETVAAGEAVYSAYDGGSSSTRYYKASNAAALDPGRNIHGIAQSAGTAGNSMNVSTVPGSLVPTNLSATSSDVGKPVYLGTGGGLTLTAPSSSGVTVFKAGYVHTYDGGISNNAVIVFQPQFVGKIP